MTTLLKASAPPTVSDSVARTATASTPGMTRRATFVLPFALAISAVAGAPGLTTPMTTSTIQTREMTYQVLRERVRTEPLKELTDPWFQVLITGRRQNGRLWTDVPLHDPANPRTLERNFGDWNLTARASLLLAYAKLVTKTDTTDHYVGLPDEFRTVLAAEATNQLRIAQIVQAGGYATDWQPFVDAYRRWIESAETRLPPGNSPDDAQTDNFVALLAREAGLFRLVRELKIDPGDVANEMLRLLDEWRSNSGEPIEATDNGPNLFYVCDSGATSVHVHPWHKLAPAFYRAWEAADKSQPDAQALLMMAMFNGISKDIKNWAATHPDADWGTRDRALNEMARTRGLYSLLNQ